MTVVGTSSSTTDVPDVGTEFDNITPYTQEFIIAMPKLIPLSSSTSLRSK